MGVIFAYFAFWDFSRNLNGTLPYWYQQVHTLGHKKNAMTCFFISFWRTKSSRAFSWSSLEDQIESDSIRSLKAKNHTSKLPANTWNSTRSLPEPSVHETLGATYVGPCSSYFSGKIPQSRIYSLLPPHQLRVETGKAATKLLLQFSTTIERLGKNGRSFEDRRYHPTWFEEPSYWLLYTHIPFICMIGWFSWYSLFIPSLLWMMAFYQIQNIRHVKKFNKFNVPLQLLHPALSLLKTTATSRVFFRPSRCPQDDLASLPISSFA